MSKSSVHTDQYSRDKPDSQDPIREADLFRSRLGELVRDRFGSVTAFLSTTGYHKSSYYAWINGTGFPEMTKLFEIAAHLGVPTRDLFTEPSGPATGAEQSAQNALLALRAIREKSAQAELDLARALGVPTLPAASLTETDRKLEATRPKPGRKTNK